MQPVLIKRSYTHTPPHNRTYNLGALDISHAWKHEQEKEAAAAIASNSTHCAQSHCLVVILCKFAHQQSICTPTKYKPHRLLTGCRCDAVSAVQHLSTAFIYNCCCSLSVVIVKQQQQQCRTDRAREWVMNRTVTALVTRTNWKQIRKLTSKSLSLPLSIKRLLRFDKFLSPIQSLTHSFTDTTFQLVRGAKLASAYRRLPVFAKRRKLKKMKKEQQWCLTAP